MAMTRRLPAPVQVAPSLLAADLTRLADEIKSLEPAGMKMIHLDVMDGHFVPEITFGQPVLRKLRKISDCFFDAHLMIGNPLQALPGFMESGADLITMHIEALSGGEAAGRGAPPGRPPQGPNDPVLDLIRSARRLLEDSGRGLGLSFRPATDPLPWLSLAGELLDLVMIMTVEPGFGGQKFMRDQLSKISAARRLREERGWRYAIEVDGGVGRDTAAACVEAGAEYLVAGTAVFGSSDRPRAIAEILRAAGSPA